MHLADEAWYHHIADQSDQQGQDHVDAEDDDGAPHPRPDRQCFDQREQREREEQADGEELYDAADPPHEVQPERGRDEQEHDPQHAAQGRRRKSYTHRIRTVVGRLA